MNETEHKCRKCGRIIDMAKAVSWYERHYRADGFVAYYCNDRCLTEAIAEIQGLIGND